MNYLTAELHRLMVLSYLSRTTRGTVEIGPGKAQDLN